LRGDDGLTLIDAGFPNKEAVAPVIASVRRFLWAEVVFLALIPAFAAPMARGYGVLTH
jgi:uncharacterized membrane protein